MSLFDILNPVVKPVVDIVKEVIDRQVVDVAGRERLKNEIEEKVALAAIQGNLAQLEVNKEEAKSTNWFVAGGRPAFFWVGCLIVLNSYIIAPYTDAIWNFHVSTLDDHMWELIFGILGLGGMRTYERKLGVARN